MSAVTYLKKQIVIRGGLPFFPERLKPFACRGALKPSVLQVRYLFKGVGPEPCQSSSGPGCACRLAGSPAGPSLPRGRPSGFQLQPGGWEHIPPLDPAFGAPARRPVFQPERRQGRSFPALCPQGGPQGWRASKRRQPGPCPPARWPQGPPRHRKAALPPPRGSPLTARRRACARLPTTHPTPPRMRVAGPPRRGAGEGMSPPGPGPEDGGGGGPCLRSVNTRELSEVVFNNRSPRSVLPVWVDFEGRPRCYPVLQPRTGRIMHSYRGGSAGAGLRRGGGLRAAFCRRAPPG